MVRSPSAEALRRLFWNLEEGHLDAVRRFFRSRGNSVNDLSRPYFRTLPHMHPSGCLYDEQPMQRIDGATCLHVSAWRGHAHIVDWLLEMGARPHVQDAYWRTPLHVATGEARELLLSFSHPQVMSRINELPGDRFAVEPSCCTGATPRELSAIRKIVLEDGGEHVGWYHQECAVCFVPWSDKLGNTVAQMPVCGHKFCEPCLGRWLGTHKTCPMCRKKLSCGEADEA